MVIGLKTNLTCGSSCIRHNTAQDTIIEINRQEDLIRTTMRIFRRIDLKYNQTDVKMRYFPGRKGPVVYDCKDPTSVNSTTRKRLTMCSKLSHIM